MAKQKHITAYERGFTLIEMMVAVGVFAIVVTITSSTFITSLKGQQKSIAMQNMADNGRYAMEIMAKEIRMGKEFTSGSDFIQFVSNMPNRMGKTVRFSFDAANSQILFDDDIGTSGDDEPITAANSVVQALRFTVSLANPNDQPRITIVLGISAGGATPEAASSMILQTSISPRSL